SLLPLPAMIRAIEMSLLASHPNVDNSEGLISVTLYDALHDMTPLQEKLGAIGEHPGVLLRDDIDNPDGFVTKSDALTDQFKMVMTISSRHRRVDGVDLSAASGGDMFIVQGDPALDFHLNDIEISGLADPPTIDMRLRIEEVTTPIEPCDDGPSCYDNAPPEQAFTGIWTEDPWNFEYFAALAGWLHYGVENPLRYYTCYAFYQGQCAATVALGHAQNAGAEIDPAAPDGWASFILTDPPFSPTLIATLPPQQYFWEMLVGIADTMYHDPNGDGVPDYETAVPQFTFHGLDIGVSTQELVDKVVESLKAQEEKLATVLVGEFWRNNDPLDFYYWRGEDGRPYLYFANEEDLRPDPQDPNKQLVPSYPTPGFYSCPEFSGCKVSQTTVLGVDDKTHEKVRLVDTQTILYVRDDQNDPYEVQFTVANDAEIFVRVTPL
ncbi:MAG: hypothetical protein KC636_35135, partial [Myxococcales bacterium]|nr:hypothetical protein [Myxococcales bacterium]